MDLNDAERYAVAALFTLALHSTHVETGVDKSGNSLSESDIAWGCPSEELFDEQLLSQVPLKLPPELLDVFWGFDAMAPAGLAPRLYAWLKIPRKAWPGLLRMPDLAGCAGSPEAVEAFVTLVRRYSAFLDPELDFTTGQASRLQQHFSLPAAIADAEGEHDEQGKLQQQPQQQEPDTAASTRTSKSASGSREGGSTLCPASQSDMAPASCKQGPPELSGSASMPASEAVAAAAASLTAAAIAAEAGPNAAAASIEGCTSATAGGAQIAPAPGMGTPQPSAAAPAAAGAVGGAPAQAAAGAEGVQVPSAAAASFNELAVAVDMLPKEADEGTVVPAATFTPAERYKHTTSHKAVLALYEVIGGCLASNTEEDMQPLFACAAQEAETAAFAAAAAWGSKKALQKFKQHQQQKQQQQASASSTLQPEQPSGSDAMAAGDDGSRPSGAWFPAADTAGDSPGQAAASNSEPSAAAAGAVPSSKQKQQKEQKEQQQPQQQQMQGLASIQWYDARARVAVKRVAHWLRVPWPQVRAFEMMWSAQALSLDAAVAQPKYSSSSRAMQYLKVGAAAVGGGALLAVTGGLAAPAIAAGLGAAVTLAHGGAAVAAAVTGFAGSTAGTAAVTGLFGAWGASVSGGSAKSLYSDVTEFGFWDLSQSIYLDGKGPEQQVQEEDAEATEKEGSAADADSSTGAAAAAVSQPAAGVCSAAGSPNKQQQHQQEKKEGASSKQAGAAAPAAAAACSSGEAQQEQSPQQTGFLHRLLSKAPDAATSGTGGSGSSSLQSAAPNAAAAGGTAAAAAAAVATAAAGRAHTPPGSHPSSPSQRPQQQPSPIASQQQPVEQGLARKSPRHLFGWGKGGQDEDEDGPAPQVRSKVIKLQDSAFNTDSDEDSEEFYDEYLSQQGSGHQGLNHQGSAAVALQPQASSTTPKQQQQRQHQQQQSQPSLVTQQPDGQQQAQREQAQSGSPELQMRRQRPEELTAVEVQHDPLSSREANLRQGSPASGQEEPQQQPEASAQAPAQHDAAVAAATKDAKQAQAEQQQQQLHAPDSSSDDLVLAAAAASAAAAGTAAAAAAAAAKEKASGSSGAAAGSKGGLSGLFTRKAPPAPVYVPLLLTPINPKHRDETRIALTIAVNGCCIESVEDFVRPWKHLPSRDCDRFAVVWESACLKELGRAVVSFIAQQALQQVAQKSIQAFLYTGLVGALALPMTLCTAMRVAFGSKWLVALRRAQAAGKMLAMQLAQGCHGGRPVTLIGCSMGARLVFHCLLELERLGLRGCVENVILLGAPLSCRPDRWCAARSVVAGRLINGYSVNDWTLGLLYRVHSSSSIWLQAAGMYKVEVPGIENINLSRLISGHQDYLEVMDDILEVINLHDA